MRTAKSRDAQAYQSAAEYELRHSGVLRRAKLLAGLAHQELADVLNQASVRHWQPDEIVFQQGMRGDEFFLIERGRLRIQQFTPEGEAVLLRFVSPGGFVGYGIADHPPAMHKPQLSSRALRSSGLAAASTS